MPARLSTDRSEPSDLPAPPAPGALRSDLARLCLPGATRDEHRELAWANSICLLFLVVGLIGLAPRPFTVPASSSSTEDIIPVVLEPQVPSPPPAEELIQPAPDPLSEPSRAPSIVVVAPADAAVAFAMPTVGNIVTANVALALPPAPKPVLQPGPAPRAERVQSTGRGGSCPSPAYPPRAVQERMQGRVEVYFEVDESGAITKTEVRSSSGHAYLDNFCADWVKRRWVFAPGEKRYFITPFVFQLR